MLTRNCAPGAAALAALLLALGGCGGEPAGEDRDGGSGAAAGNARAAELGAGIAALERRRTRLEDISAIKRLQRQYGYYVDAGRWDAAADLFAADGSIEIARDGVYVGRDRVREYLHAFGEGRTGLARGQLNERMQLMPVVTIGPDGRTARARWRGLVMAGRHGQEALWGEGPYENEYVKQDGVWQIRRLHWFQTFLVPYDGGWIENADANAGRYVSDELPPDEPPTFEYAPWPNTFLPPFHFDNPVTGGGTGRAPDDGASGAAQPAGSSGSAAALAERAAVLAQQVELLEAEHAIENLQRTYGYFIEEGLWSEAAALFADDGTLEIAGRGVYAGRDRVLEYLRSLGPEHPQDGRLFDRMQLQPVVHVAPDGETAKARWRLFAQEARHGEFAEWGVGWYENDYVREDGVWKIDHQRLYIRMYTPYEDGWGETALEAPTYSSSLEPDRASTLGHAPYPAMPDPDYHYDNPVRGDPVYAGAPGEFATVPADAGYDAVADTIDTLDARIGRLEDTAAIERLHAVYGYYLARYQMDDLAAIFAEDGTIEIAQRGVYVGRESVRRNLDLYEEIDLHNHMQYQPVIHVGEDGRTANMRSRAFSIMGEHGEYGMWMGGVYENEFVKRDGIWRIRKDQVFNTYFVPYETGWKDAPPREPPGISESNPPDRPPSVEFDMYPTAFLPPFHYAHPVTGEPVRVPDQE